MTRQKLLDDIKNALQREDDLQESTLISDIKEWDSMAMISLISLYDSLFSINMTYAELGSFRTIADLINRALGDPSGK